MSHADDRHYLRAAVEGLKCMCAAEHLETLDALKAENQRLRDALTEIAMHTQLSNVTYGSGIAVEPSKSALVARTALNGIND